MTSLENAIKELLRDDAELGMRVNMAMLAENDSKSEFVRMATVKARAIIAQKGGKWWPATLER